MQCIIMENTLIKLTLHDETKKRAHDSQIVRAKENLKLSHGGSRIHHVAVLRPAIHAGVNTAPSCININLKWNKQSWNNTESATTNMRLNSDRLLGTLQNSYLHKLHLQSLPLQLEIRALNWLKLLTCLKLSGKLFHRTAAANLKLFLPYFVVRTCGTCKTFWYLKL